MGERVIGVVTEVNRFPVKSMRAEPLEVGDLRWTGLHGDRQYAYLKQTDRGRFPWLTGRDVSELVLWRARYEDPADPRGAALRVTTPDGEEHAADDPAVLAHLAAAAGEPIGLLQIGRGCFDAMPISVLATTTEAALDTLHGAPLGTRRFRANVVIRTDAAAGREVDWCGRSLRFGEAADAAQVAVDWAIPRCAMVTIDPDTAAREPAVLRRVAQDFANEIGAYATPERLGRIAVGDPVILRDRA
ncbi:MAG: MOSC domain-containing protein [Rhodospirillales bacterium]|nr:MOSC domain-containing protein [Rhodospirillales bacterium]